MGWSWSVYSFLGAAWGQGWGHLQPQISAPSTVPSASHALSKHLRMDNWVKGRPFPSPCLLSLFCPDHRCFIAIVPWLILISAFSSPSVTCLPRPTTHPNSPHWLSKTTVTTSLLDSNTYSDSSLSAEQISEWHSRSFPTVPRLPAIPLLIALYRTGYSICGWGLGQNENVESHCKNLFRCSRQQQQHIQPSMAGSLWVLGPMLGHRLTPAYSQCASSQMNSLFHWTAVWAHFLIMLVRLFPSPLLLSPLQSSSSPHICFFLVLWDLLPFQTTVVSTLFSASILSSAVFKILFCFLMHINFKNT